MRLNELYTSYTDPVQTLKRIADDSRGMDVLKALVDGSQTPGDLGLKLGIGRAAVQFHLKDIRPLIESERIKTAEPGADRTKISLTLVARDLLRNRLMTDPKNVKINLMDYRDFCVKNGELISALRRLFHNDEWISHRGPITVRIIAMLLRLRRLKMRTITQKLNFNVASKEQRLPVLRGIRALREIGLIDRVQTSWIIQPLKRPAILIVWRDVSQSYRDRLLGLYPDLEALIMKTCRISH